MDEQTSDKTVTNLNSNANPKQQFNSFFHNHTRLILITITAFIAIGISLIGLEIHKQYKQKQLRQAAELTTATKSNVQPVPQLQESTEKTLTDNEVIPENIKPTNWITFTSTKHNYSFMYPENYVFMGGDNSMGARVEIHMEHATYPYKTFIIQPYGPFENLSEKENYYNSLRERASKWSHENKKISTIVVDGIEGDMLEGKTGFWSIYKEDPYDGQFWQTYILVKTSNTIYEIIYFDGVGQENKDYFNKVLESIKFSN